MISVIVPVFNSGSLVLHTLNSILSQTFKDFEIILVNDGSTDNTLEILRTFKSKSRYGNQISIHSQGNQGPSIARNNGLKIAKGKYTQFFDADDIMHPYKLKASLEMMVHYNADAVVSDFKRFSNSNNLDVHMFDFDDVSVVTGMDATKYVLQYGIGAPRVLYRTDALRAIGGFNEELINNEDHELNFRLVCNKAKFIYVPVFLMFYRQHNSPYRITRSNKRFIQSINASKVILQQLDELEDEELKALVARWQANKIGYSSVNLIRLGEVKLGKKCLDLAKSIHPDLRVSNSAIYNLVGKMFGVGSLDYFIGGVRNIFK